MQLRSSALSRTNERETLMKWILTIGHGEITECISDYSGEEQFLVGGVYIGRGVLRERSGKKMEWKHDYGLQGAIQDWKMFSSVAEDLRRGFYCKVDQRSETRRNRRLGNYFVCMNILFRC